MFGMAATAFSAEPAKIKAITTVPHESDSRKSATRDFSGCLPDSIRTIALVMPASIQNKKRFDSGKALKAGRAEMAQIRKDFAAKMTCPVYENYPYGHVPISYAIDFLREKTITAEGILKQ
jgi:hypothetical protein